MADYAGSDEKAADNGIATQAMYDLGGAVEKLRHFVDKLERRIGPVLGPQEPVPSNPHATETKPVASTSDVTMRCRSIRDEVERATQQLADLCGRCEL